MQEKLAGLVIAKREQAKHREIMRRRCDPLVLACWLIARQAFARRLCHQRLELPRRHADA